MTRSQFNLSNCRTRLVTLAVMIVSLFFFTACGEDEVSNQACTFDEDCVLGTVCGAGGSCVTAACDFCTAEQICYKTPSNPEGSCSAPQCHTSDDCNGQRCVQGLCQSAASGCTKEADCPEGQTCSLAGTCVDKPVNTNECEDSTQCNIDAGEVCRDNKCVVPPCTANSCGEGKVCGEDGKCVDGPSCNDEDCAENERCLPSTGACGVDCVSDASICTGGEMCDKPTATCVPNPCAGIGVDPETCGGNTPHFSVELNCSCVQCTDNSHCGPGKVCGANGTCTADQCATPCDSSQPGTCNGAPGTPYCVGGCCSQCIGAADCPSGQLCLDGFCGVPPNCDIDPTVCPQGYTCEAGQCKPPQTGQGCNPQDPTSCPAGTFCGLDNTCQSAGGELGCGLCNPDCTCPNGLTCDGLMCDGCQVQIGGTSQCPAGTQCWPFGNIWELRGFCGPKVI